MPGGQEWAGRQEPPVLCSGNPRCPPEPPSPGQGCGGRAMGADGGRSCSSLGRAEERCLPCPPSWPAALRGPMGLGNVV